MLVFVPQAWRGQRCVEKVLGPGGAGGSGRGCDTKTEAGQLLEAAGLLLASAVLLVISGARAGSCPGG
jgi:hypothetical protein